MSSSPLAGPPYSRRQRLVALGYGVVCHTLFAASVVAMFVSLYSGLTSGLLHLHGWPAALMDVLLLVQFAAAHSLMLSDRGRRFMAHLAPLGLGRDLSTTIFAAIASLQLLATFLLWSPSGIIWAAPDGPIKTGLTAAYLVSWVLLAKSMSDAGLDVQLGVLGWRSIWKNHRPVYQPFARTGTFRHSRQPIYSSFTLILWTAPVWTPDHLVLTLLWTVYCVLAPALKEQRFRRFYGDAFARYQQRVPYWFPRLRPAPMPAIPPGSAAPDCDVAIVGAGPVGLLLANLLGPTGLKIVILEKRTAPPTHSRAIGITPPSLEILARADLADAFVVRGVKISDVHVHGSTGRLGRCSFRELKGRHPYILSLPQENTLALLEQNLRRFPNVSVQRGREVLRLTQHAGQAELELQETKLSARFVVACDGWRSGIRSLLKIRTQEKEYP
ncbi:MAG TPA: FAD-dependent monooxygenase, partial [Verrucomicrobium sp.]|nr:FAD-dependent monooxygenase [Verrucomicrobium sp.]